MQSSDILHAIVMEVHRENLLLRLGLLIPLALITVIFAMYFYHQAYSGTASLQKNLSFSVVLFTLSFSLFFTAIWAVIKSMQEERQREHEKSNLPPPPSPIEHRISDERDDAR